MWVLEDPAQKRSVRDREIVLSSIRSYNQAWVCKRDRKHQQREVRRPKTCKAALTFRHILPANAQSLQINGNSPTNSTYQSSLSDESSSSSYLQVSNSGCSDTSDTSSIQEDGQKVNSDLSICLRNPNTYQSWMNFSSDEIRGFQFFCEKTATSGAGWRDCIFWSQLALQTIHSVPGLQHAFVALASVHEMYATTDAARKQALWDLGLSEGRKALRALSRSYSKMSISAILTTYMVLTTYSATLRSDLYYQTMKKQNDIVDRLTLDDDQSSSLTSATDRHYALTYLCPIVTQERNHNFRIIDLVGNLAECPASTFWRPQEVQVGTFSELSQARNVLEDVLNFITYEIKSEGYPTNYISAKAARLLLAWYRSLDLLEQETQLPVMERYSLNLLRVCAELNVIAIKTMNTENEIVFDEYLDTYKSLVNVGQQYLALQSKGAVPTKFFGLDAGWITLFGHTIMRWCREPAIRHELIDILRKSNRSDGGEQADIWASVCERVKNIEESRLPVRPQHASDVPAESRIVKYESLIYSGLGILRLRYVSATNKDGDIMDTFIKLHGDDASFEDNVAQITTRPPQLHPQILPDVRVRKDCHWTLDRVTNEYSCYQSSQFNFCLPRY